MILHFCFRTIVAVAGEDFSVIASDTRLSEGFSIHSRDQSKLYNLTKTTVLGACGFHGDVLTLTKLLRARMKVINRHLLHPNSEVQFRFNVPVNSV